MNRGEKVRKILFIVNPVAGNGSGPLMIQKIQNYMGSKNIEYQVKVSNRVGNVTDLADWGCKELFTDIVSVGGDGTLIEALNGIDLECNVTLGVIPSGTGNDFARVLKMPRDLTQCLDVILENKQMLIDIGDINGKRFINSCGCGIDSQILMDTQKIKKAVHGPTAYMLSTFKNLASYNAKKIKLTIDGNEYLRTVILLAIANGNYFGGGMMIAPNAKVDDGLLDVCVINDLNKIKLITLFPSIFKGEHIRIKPTVEMFQGKEIRIENIQGEMVANADGNLIGTTPLFVKIGDKKMKVIFNDLSD